MIVSLICTVYFFFFFFFETQGRKHGRNLSWSWVHIYHGVLNIKYSMYILTLYGPNYFFRRFSGDNLIWALFVYRLIGATLIGIFFDDPFLK